MNISVIARLAIFVLLGSLTACGGGSGGGTPAAISATATTTAQNLTVGTAMTSFSPLTASGGTTPYTYSYTGTLPAGLSYDASTGVVSGTPTAVYATASLVFSVKDAINAVASTTSTVSFAVDAAPVSLSATATTTAQSLTVGVAMASFLPLTASGGTTPYTYSHTGTLPAGLNFDTGTGAVTGTPNAVYATASLVFSVQDATNAVASTTSSVSFTVASALNDTGQTLCDDGTNTLVACTPANSGDTSAMPRQDANFGRDALATAGTLSKTGGGEAGFDYTRVCMSGELAGTGACAANPVAAVDQAAPTANEWACTKDNVTKLIWSLEPQSAVWADATTTLPAAANVATRCGFNTGWRLPTRRELLSILHNGVATSPAVDTAYFPGTVASYYWSNDTYAPVPTGAWDVNFYGGNTNAGLKTVSGSVRLVHGTPLPDAAMTDNGDGTVTDTTTGLMWDQCSQGQSGAGCATGTASTMTWSAALTAAVTANGAVYKGYSDWRLPNKNELETLVDISVATDPTINLTAFPATPASSVYWSSTTYTPVPANAWYVNFFDGNTNAIYKTNVNSVRLVRSGQ